MTNRVLVVPDPPEPRRDILPAGWFETEALPAIEAMTEWTDLDLAEGRIKAMAKIVESLDGDSLELEKAMRIVEKRRGEVLGLDDTPGRGNTNPQRAEDIPASTAANWRNLARYWDDLLWPHLLKADHRKDVTQRALLRLIPAAPIKAATPNGQVPDLFTTVVIDPPWRYDNVATRGAAENHYPTMSLEQLANLDIPAAADSHIYLWVTNAFLRQGFDLLTIWGFDYKTCLTWCKPSIGLGNYFRNNTEHVLFGVRGKAPTLRNDVGTWFEARKTKHSAKPESFYDLVESCSPGPFLEMFARRRRLGWHVWGQEA